MADDAKTSPATATTPGAPAPSTKDAKVAKKPQLGPIGKILARLDAEIVDARAVVDTLGKQKSEVQKAIAYAKTQGMSEKATIAIVTQILPAEDEPTESKRGRPKGSKNKAGKHKGGRGVTISKTIITKIQRFGKEKLSAYAIGKRVGVSPKTAAKYM